jgi:hypothetical protein
VAGSEAAWGLRWSECAAANKPCLSISADFVRDSVVLMSVRMSKSRMRVFLFLLLTITISGYGQEAAQAKDRISAAEILQKNLIATGGLEAHKSLENLVANGEIRLNSTDLLGDYEFSYKSPNDDILEVRGIRREATRTGHHKGQRFYRPVSQTPEPSGFCLFCVSDGVYTWIVEHDWLMLTQWDFCCDYKSIELIGFGEVDKRLAYGLRFTRKKGGDPFVCFYDRETFLLVRIDHVQRSNTSQSQADSWYRVESIFRDYREQGGVKLPFVIAIPRPQGDVVFELSNVKTGAPVKDSVFH